MKKYGFTIIELMISFLIASILATGLLVTIAQMGKTQETLISLTSVYGRVALAQNQLERDIMGAFVPAQTDMIQTSTEKKEQPKELDKIFYGTNEQGGRFKLLTCITSSPLEVFYGVKNAQLKPRVARVVYRLAPDPKRKNSFILMRQEGSSSLYFDAYKEDADGQLRSFALIDGIQNFTINYITIEQSKKSEDEQVKSERTYKKVAQWDSGPKKNEKPEKEEADTTQESKKIVAKKEPARLPNQIMVEIALWDSGYKNIKTFNFTIPIVYKASEYELPPEPKEEKPKEDKPEQKVAEAKKEGAQ